MCSLYSPIVHTAHQANQYSHYLYIQAYPALNEDLWLAATHGTANILPRVVSLNLATRLVFRVQDAAAASLAGCPGAQHIPRDKPGRMWARLEGEPVELQAYWLDDEALAEIARDLARRQ